MKAVLSKSVGGPETLVIEDLPSPVAGPGQVWTRRYRFPAERDRNRLLAVAAAVDSLRRLLQAGDDRSPWEGRDTGDTNDSWTVRP
jgi:hypothetical protein